MLLQGYTIGLSGGLNISEVSVLVMNSMPNLQIKERIKLLINKIEEGNSFSKAIEDTSLLNELELKIKELVSSLEREREKNAKSDKAVHESQKLSLIEEKVKNLIKIIDQMEKQ